MRASTVDSKGKVSWPIGLRPEQTRRITKIVGSLVTHLFYNSQWKIVEEREGTSTSPSRASIWGIRYRDDLVRRTATFTPSGGGSPVTETAYALHDYYNVTAIVNASGVVQERYGYTAFGETRFMAADYTPKTASTHAWDILYKAQQRDTETGYYNYGYRFYLPQLGRWPSRDPIAEKGGFNLYGAVNNNGINGTDYLGLAVTINSGQASTTYKDADVWPTIDSLVDFNMCRKSCKLRKAPEYNKSGTIVAEDRKAIFAWSAAFYENDINDPKCCEVRQQILSPKNIFPPHFPSDTLPNTWYEDRDDLGYRYGRRTGDFSQPSPNDRYNDDDNTYLGIDQPERVPYGTTYKFRLIVVDVCNLDRIIYTSKELTVEFPALKPLVAPPLPFQDAPKDNSKQKKPEI